MDLLVIESSLKDSACQFCHLCRFSGGCKRGNISVFDCKQSFMVQSDEDKAVDLDNPDIYFSPQRASVWFPQLIQGILVSCLNFYFFWLPTQITCSLSGKIIIFFQVGYEFLLHHSLGFFFVWFGFIHTQINICVWVCTNMFIYAYTNILYIDKNICAHLYICLHFP